jgi:hypothetical protein
MYSKKSNKILWIVFGVLLVAVVLIFTSESSKKERSFKKDIVSIDTASISSFSIFPKSKPGTEVRFLKNGDNWTVSSSVQNKSFSVPESKIENIFSELSRIKPKRVAARSQSKWAEYQVDSAATRIVVNEDGSEVLNLIIGKFSFQQPRSMSTYVRLMGENDVYEVDGFLEMTFNKDVNSFRDETLIKADKAQLNKISFDYGSADSFELVKINDKWTIEGTETDSAKTEKALNSFLRLTNTDFVDDINENLMPPQIQKVVIERIDKDPIELLGYKDNTKYLVHSSLNTENYFDGEKIGDKIFLKKESFF